MCGWGCRPGWTGGMLAVGDWLVSRTFPAASTVRGYAAHVRLYLGPRRGEALLAELSAGQVQAMVTAIIRRHPCGGDPGVGRDADPDPRYLARGADRGSSPRSGSTGCTPPITWPLDHVLEPFHHRPGVDTRTRIPWE
jgi:hypothetical protein